MPPFRRRQKDWNATGQNARYTRNRLFFLREATHERNLLSGYQSMSWRCLVNHWFKTIKPHSDSQPWCVRYDVIHDMWNNETWRLRQTLISEKAEVVCREFMVLDNYLIQSCHSSHFTTVHFKRRFLEMDFTVVIETCHIDANHS